MVLGTSLIFVTRQFAGDNPFPGQGVGQESPDQTFTPSHVFWADRLNENLVVGFGVYNPYGLITEWENPDTFTGRFVSTEASLTPIFFNPVVAYSPSPTVRVGGGIMVVRADLELNQHIAQPNPFGNPGVLELGRVVLEGDNGLDFGINLGLQVDINERITAGATYRSKIPVDYEGQADFTFVGTGTPLDPTLALLFPSDQDVAVQIDFPANLVLGLSVEANDQWLIEGNLGWTGWSSFDRLDLIFTDPSLNETRLQNWNNALFFRVGAEVEIQPDTQVRFGYYFDETPQPTEALSPILPDNDRHGLSIGIGKDWGQWNLDAFGLLLLIADRSTDGINLDGYEGTYANAVQIFGFSVGYQY